MIKYRLMAPGPTPIPEDVLAEMAKPILHHRTAAFEAVMAEVRDGLKWLHQTQNEVLIFASSGSGAMEAALTNAVQVGESVLVVNGGKFGERFIDIAKGYGFVVDEIRVEWGRAVDTALIAQKLQQKTYRAVCVQASETSTGVQHPIQKIAELVRGYSQTLLIVDAITALGVMDLPMDAWGIDLLVGGSQKALMLPPGLATLGVSDKVWGVIEKNSTPKHYFDLRKEKKAIVKNTTAYTPAVSLIVGLRLVLQKMRDEGLPAIFKRHADLAASIRAAALAIGLKLFAPEHPANSVTAIYAPPGIDSGKIVQGLSDRFNMTIAEGQDAVKGKIFRIGHIGYYDLFDMITVWSAVEKQLSDLGYKFELGAGVREILKRL